MRTIGVAATVPGDPPPRLAHGHLRMAPLAGLALLIAAMSGCAPATASSNVRVAAPLQGTIVNGPFTFSAVSAVPGTKTIIFSIDGRWVAAAGGPGPLGWTASYNSAQMTPGIHSVTAIAVDVWGTAHVSAAIGMAVSGSTNAFHGMLGVQQPYPTTHDIYAAIADSGNDHAKIVRFEQQVPSGNNWNYSNIDRGLADAQAHGVRLMLSATYTPGDLQSHYYTYPRSDAAQNAWSDRVASVIARYRGRFAAVELSNEPNGWQFGADNGSLPVDAGSYGRLLLKAYPKIKAADPGIVVVAGGTAPAPTDGKQMSPEDWYRGIAATLGGRTGFDAAAHHAYGTDPLYGIHTADAIHAMFPNQTLWLTEQGCSLQDHSEPAQAAWLATQIDAFRSRSWAGAYFYFTWQDRGVSGDKYTVAGLRRNDGSPRPSFFVFAQRG